MKTKMFAVVLLLLLVMKQPLNAHDYKAPIRIQLEQLNQYWKNQPTNYQLPDEGIPIENEIQLIQTHLSLVEKNLRSKSTAHLSESQRANRSLCLNILHDYWVKGMFPKNLYHPVRTPYFIDQFGTACAVGQLLISTGFGKFAQKVNEEQNNGYIKELNVAYPELGQWAHEYGFDVEELAWIQPCYCSATVPGTVHISCNGGAGGYFVPNVVGLQAPLTYSFYKWSNSAWAPVFYMCGPCNLTAGSYKTSIEDGLGVVHDFSVTLTQPPPISFSTTTSGNAVACNGVATMSVSGGVAPYTLTIGSASTGSVLTNLCQQVYTISVTDSKGCWSYTTVDMTGPTALSEYSGAQLAVFPNPASDALHMDLQDFFKPGKTVLLLYSYDGRLCEQISLTASESTVPLGGFQPGLYIFSVENGTALKRGRFIKE